MTNKNILLLIILLVIVGLIYFYRYKIIRAIKLLMSNYTYFTLDEFDSPDEPGSGARYMKKSFVRRLDFARDIADTPFKIVSGYRTEAYNKKVGGVEGSAHTKGISADIDYTTEEEKIKILTGLVKMGFNRFGIRTGASGSSIHVDDDKTKSQYVVWGYNDVDPGINPWALT